jgi:hypothetical protein
MVPESGEETYEVPGSPSETRIFEPVRYETPGGRVLMEARGEGISGVDRPGGRVTGAY